MKLIWGCKIRRQMKMENENRREEHLQLTTCNSSHSVHMFYIKHNSFHCSVITGGVVILTKVTAKDQCNCLPERSAKASFVILYYFITVIACLTINEFHQNFSLVNRKLSKLICKLSFKIFFSCLYN